MTQAIAQNFRHVGNSVPIAVANQSQRSDCLGYIFEFVARVCSTSSNCDLKLRSKSCNMHDHDEYSMRFENEEEEVYLDDGLDISNENSINTYMKHGDELLIDMVRSRPYLYNKMVQNYKDAEMKENAWTEIATALNITCK